jgi:hypothetical protein
MCQVAVIPQLSSSHQNIQHNCHVIPVFLKEHLSTLESNVRCSLLLFQSAMVHNIVACLLKAGIAEPVETPVAK